mmetsp:Transcript_135633/g.220716  ORF Transcript_135633/g.220716 Transcript_135633/m.220716 type:complete len:319 (-) Transcript_135633:61-1017(-)
MVILAKTLGFLAVCTSAYRLDGHENKLHNYVLTSNGASLKETAHVALLTTPRKYSEDAASSSAENLSVPSEIPMGITNWTWIHEVYTVPQQFQDEFKSSWESQKAAATPVATGTECMVWRLGLDFVVKYYLDQHDAFCHLRFMKESQEHVFDILARSNAAEESKHFKYNLDAQPHFAMAITSNGQEYVMAIQRWAPGTELKSVDGANDKFKNIIEDLNEFAAEDSAGMKDMNGANIKYDEATNTMSFIDVDIDYCDEVYDLSRMLHSADYWYPKSDENVGASQPNEKVREAKVNGKTSQRKKAQCTDVCKRKKKRTGK